MSSPNITSTQAARSTTERIDALEQRLKQLERWAGVGNQAREFHGTLDGWNKKVRSAIVDLQTRAGLPANQMIDPPDADHVAPPPPPPFE